MEEIPQTVRERLTSSPGLPKPNPTTSIWQVPPHPTISDRQSETLPKVSNIVIIGSGITGCAVAHTLLNESSTAKLSICVLEARQTASGATGRNGGHLISDSASLAAPLAESLGDEVVASMAKFSEANIKCLKSMVMNMSEADQQAVELREVLATAAFQDKDMFSDAKGGNELIQKLHPESSIKDRTVSKSEAVSKYKYNPDFHGALEQHGAAALWPYRLVTRLFEEMLDKFQDRFSLEANTPAISIEYEEGHAAPYCITTPRGILRARKVVHCTNGFSGHLLPRLIGSIYPLRGTMSTQKPGPDFPPLGDRVSWSRMSKPTFDPKTLMFGTGLYYAQQNAHTGEMFIGGEHEKITDMLSSDDSVVAKEARESLLSVLPQIFSQVEPIGEQRVWSGIMGFSSDGLPLVGKLDAAVTDRNGDGEWIAAGFNGHGMDKCWLTGAAVAKMVLGEAPPAYLPTVFLLTPERLRRMGIEQAVAYWVHTLSRSSSS